MEIEIIKTSIHEIRGKKVILDFELAKMYHIETKYLKRTVKNNLKRFPNDFMFELSDAEWQNLRCKFSTSSWGGPRYAPFAFTEQGIAMLSGLLNSEIAIETNISIMRAFVMMRQWALTHQELSKRLDTIEQQYGQKFSDIEQVLNFLILKDQKQAQHQQRDRIGFKK
jgi:hypothetical protein